MAEGVYTVGGTVQANERGLYIPRAADEELLQLCRESKFAYVLTPRQMGKSSLMIRTAEQLIDEGAQAVIIDLSQVGVHLSAEEWYRGLLTMIADQLMLSVSIADWWQEYDYLGITQRLTRFFQQVVVTEVQSPIAIFVDEIDTTLSLDFTDDFYAAIRSLYVARATQPDLRRLSFVLIGVAMPGDLIRDPKRTPFNIGQRVDLTDFTAQEALPLAAGLELTSAQAEQTLGWVLKWTGGHPYLTQRLCQAITQVGGSHWSETEVDRLVSSTFLGQQSDQDNNLQFVRDMLTERAPEPVAVLQTYREIRRGKRPVLDEEQSLVKSHLKLSGVVRREGRALRIRNPIYRRVFDRSWIKTHLPESFWQRIKPALPLIAFLLVVIVAMSSLTVYALKQTSIANLRERAAVVLNWLPTGRAVDGLVLAIQTTGQSRNQKLSEVYETVDFSLLSAAQLVKQQNRIQEHTEAVNCVAFSPDGQHIVSASGDKTLRLWDLQGTAIGQPFRGHTDSVNSVAFSPDGQHIVSASWDKTLRLWDLQGTAIGQPFRGHTASVDSVAFSPDGQHIVSGSGDKTLRLWDLQGRAVGQPFRGHTAYVSSVAFSPDGQHIVSGSASGDKTLRLWDLQGRAVGQPFRGHTAYVSSVAFSPDGQHIVSGSGDGSLRLWDLQGRAVGQPFRGHTDVVSSVAFSPNGQHIVSGSADSSLRLWNLQGRAVGQPFQEHTDVVSSVAFSPDGQHIVSASGDKTLRLWDLQGTAIGQPFRGHTDVVSSVAFSPDGQYIVSGSASGDGSLRLWDLQGRAVGQPFRGHTDVVSSVTFSPDGQYIVSASWDGSLRLWDLQGRAIGQPFRGHTAQRHGDPVDSVAFSPDGQHIVSGSWDDSLRLWDLQGRAIGQPFRGHTGSVDSVAFSPDGQHIVSGSWDGSLRLWDLQGRVVGQPFQGHTSIVNSVAFSPDGQYIVSGSADKTLRLWDLQGRVVGQPFRGHTGSVDSVAFSPDGQYIVSGSGDRTLRLWDLQGRVVGQPFQGHTASVSSVAFSPDGYIVSGSADRTLRLWHGSWQGWLQAGCDRLRYHPILQNPDSSFDPAIAKGAKQTCEQYVWSQESNPNQSQLLTPQLSLAARLRQAVNHLSSL